LVDMTAVLDFSAENCSIGRALSVLGEKWTLLVLRDVFNGIRRFDDMHERVGAPRQVLSQRLARLVDEGILRRVPYREPGQRQRYEYRLTEKGVDLYPTLVALLRWGDRWLVDADGPAVTLHHRDCGAPVDVVLRCADGHDIPSAREVRSRPGPGARPRLGRDTSTEVVT
jgi:DNA-binding HxlR family transcriptional regulator